MSHTTGDPLLDRSPPAVAEGRRYLPTWQKVALYGITLLGLLALFILLRSPLARRTPPERPAPVTMEGGLPWRPPAPLPEPAAPPAPTPLPALPPAMPMPLPLPAPAPAVLPTQPLPQPAPRVDPLRAGRVSPIMSGRSAAATPPAAPGPGVAPDAGPVQETALGARLRPTVLQGSRATVLPYPDLTITQGSKIPCIVQDAIDTTLPGMVTCTVPIDIRGTTGRVTLLDRGTRIVGQLQNGPVQGQRRAFIIWTRAETPNHVIITLDSPAADQLGRAGLEGEVDTHFWTRFGGALMLSFIDSGLQAAANLAAASSGGTNYFSSFQSGGQNAAATALNSTVNIPPTLRRHQGQTATVFVARDLSFEGVYTLRLRQ